MSRLRIGRVLLLLAAVTLGGCAIGVAVGGDVPSACAGAETSYACQVERYHNVNVQ